MSHNYETRFELKPNKWIYVPTEQAKIDGLKIVTRLRSQWTPWSYYYHLYKAGGHVAAMRPHAHQIYKASIDLRYFFSSCTRTKVARSLRLVGYSSKDAFDVAHRSCVVSGRIKHLPYGFPQSMHLATLVIDRSGLGSELRHLQNEGIVVSMYVDDILISSDCEIQLKSAYDRILKSIEGSNFDFSPTKLSPPASTVTAFNCEISDRLKVLPDRMNIFREQLRHANEHARDAILRYVGVICEDQRTELESKIP